jgi:hypothetical protein
MIRLEVFTGRPNPVWRLSGDVERRLIDWLQPATSTVQVGAGLLKGWLGYRGFTISDLPIVRRRPKRQDVDLPAAAREGIRQAMALAPYPSGFLSPFVNPELEAWLIGTAGTQLDRSIREYVERFIENFTSMWQGGPASPGCPPCNAADAPSYNPLPWNTPTAQPRNNCYAYANNQKTNTFPQPGRASGHTITPPADLRCGPIRRYSEADGLTVASDFSGSLAAGDGWYVALVIWPGRDYHWYRQDKNGCWSHKPGQTPVVNTDNAGKPIRDPRTCDRGPYTDFCTFMISKSSVTIR